ncbi:L-ascorbate metabolism protein UlaG (beta-lactamase superfamily) [Motilibacter rhizosphaerae]|uniref:L-ascorbate metabolism protein UlaG (Beta-lactamase superfamily) n=1 Tax=Motilibacter rhizosphaerae TaxID=598652 RepID=A0A4Q7NQJ8_9ACTN|nr:MBL fold metallo-hydrolase [Motilibacter rhizosphaerae]RZS87601.1 L-ascorbate metabolism protein UlaG (beta-lactamase superfamily) [Motilibacter rhizosphaerae]
MKITKLGHSCLLVEEAGARILVDPGAFSAWDDLDGLDAVLVTHQHFDHVVPDKVQGLLDRNPGAQLVVDPGTAEVLGQQGVQGAKVLGAGETVDVKGVEVRGSGRDHALFHEDAGTIPNTGYLIGGRLFHPGDALTVPDFAVEVLAVPVVAPWSSIRETIDFVRAVGAGTVFPIHDAIIVEGARPIYDDTVEGLGLQGKGRFLRIDGEPLEV